MKIVNVICSWCVLKFDIQYKSLNYSHILKEMQVIDYRDTKQNLAIEKSIF